MFKFGNEQAIKVQKKRDRNRENNESNWAKVKRKKEHIWVGRYFKDGYMRSSQGLQ